MMKDLHLTINDFPDFDSPSAGIIVEELNALLDQSTKTRGTSTKRDSRSISDLRADMITSPELYLKDETIKRLDLVKFGKDN